MLFNSVTFFVFFAIVYALYRLLPFRGQNWMLLAAGYVFYGWWDIHFLFLIAFSTTVDFWIGLLLGDGRIPLRQRVLSSAFIIAVAALALNIDWRVMAHGGLLPLVAITPIGGLTFAGTVGIVFFANAVHPFVARLDAGMRRRILLFATVAVNLGFLAVFKYFNFFGAGVRAAFESAHWRIEPIFLEVVLPVGISFYTFQSLSYTIDVARGHIAPARRFFDFALFVAFFPPLMAGPIERARHLLPQLQRPRTIRLQQSMDSVVLILYGLVKKVAIADGLAGPVDAVFNSTGAVSTSDVALATVLFAFQIFCDFSGYTDIARGVAKLLGIDLMLNFDVPYLSRNPSEFWRRWHISLSSWLRDYLYIALGGNRKSEARVYANLMATMTLGGLWHGAAVNYVLWGAYQGVLLCAHRAITGKRNPLPTGKAAATGHAPGRYAVAQASATTVLSIAVFFVFMCYGWMLFRAHSLEQIARFTSILTGRETAVASILPVPPLAALAGLIVLVALQFAEWRDGRPECFRFWPWPLQGVLYAALLFILAMGTSNAPAQFIYFQF